jgi:hypothetical protein
MTVTVASFTQPPLVPLPWTPPRLTTAQLQAAVAGTFAAGPMTAAIITAIGDTWAFLDNLNAKMAAQGALNDSDAKSLAVRTAALPNLHQQIGLFPVGSQTPAQQP